MGFIYGLSLDPATFFLEGPYDTRCGIYLTFVKVLGEFGVSD
jgi:hypothetical protein